MVCVLYASCLCCMLHVCVLYDSVFMMANQSGMTLTNLVLDRLERISTNYINSCRILMINSNYFCASFLRQKLVFLVLN